MPISDADYLLNLQPDYPRMSQALGEEGTTVVRVLIGPTAARRTRRSPGPAASPAWTRRPRTARSWRYVPGKRGGVPEAMWVNVPSSGKSRVN